jgi:hypothetical protein
MRKWFAWSHWRYLLRFRLYGYVERARRGYSSQDLWSFDYHLARVIAGGLRDLAERAHGYPCDFPGEHEGWQAWLRDKAEWFEWYKRDEPDPENDWTADGITADERRRRIQAHHAKMDRFFNEVLPDFGKYFGALWD